MTLKEITERFTQALDDAADKAVRFVREFAHSAHRLLTGDLDAAEPLRQCLYFARSVDGCIFVTPLPYLKVIDPVEEDAIAFDSLRTSFTAFGRCAREICRACALPENVLNRFNIRHNEVFSVGFFANYSPPVAKNDARLLQILRERLIDHICKVVCQFFKWLADQIEALVKIVGRMKGAFQKPHRFVIPPQIQHVVAVADQIGVKVLDHLIIGGGNNVSLLSDLKHEQELRYA